MSKDQHVGERLGGLSLEEVEAHAWGEFVRGAQDRRGLFHTPAVATVKPDGSPSVRTVVLRGADADARTLRFHTDNRSAKFGEIETLPAVSLHAYESEQKLQIRCEGSARLHHGDDVAREAWESSAPPSRECYRIDPGPGAAIARPEDAVIGDAGDGTAGFDRFVAVVIQVTAIEWLFLRAVGHRRARIEYAADGVQRRWLVP